LLWTLQISSDSFLVDKCLSSVYGFDEKAFRAYLDKYVVMFLDDILVYSNSYIEHKQHLRSVIQVLRENTSYAKLDNCEFWLIEVVFLGHVISVVGLLVDPRKVEVVLNLERPTNMIKIRSFSGLVRYYWRCIEGFSTITSHLTRLTCKEVRFVWSKKCNECFKKLKRSNANLVIT